MFCWSIYVIRLGWLYVRTDVHAVVCITVLLDGLEALSAVGYIGWLGDDRIDPARSRIN